MPKIKWLGHATLLIEGNGTKILVDPFIKDNPAAKVDLDSVDADYILVTHGHPDHFGDTIEIAKKKNSCIIAIYEIVAYVQRHGIKNFVSMNVGGKKTFDFGWVKMVPAMHSSSIMEEGKTVYGGCAVGFVLHIEGKTIYLAGDTTVFKDMELIGNLTKPDLAVLPIGGSFTMDSEEAVLASVMLGVRKIIPIHYNTWDIIEVDVNKFKDDCAAKGIDVIVLDVNDEYEL